MRTKTLVLIILLALTLVINIPNPTRQGVASPPPQGNYATFTVYPDGSVGATAQMYQSPVPYLKNINVTHYDYITEGVNLTNTVTDSISPTTLYVGRNASVYWWINCCTGHFNHTVTITGPQSATIKVYPNATSLNRAVRFNMTGTYNFWSRANNSTANRSSTGQIYVIGAEENEISETNFGANLSKMTSEVLLTENFNRTLNTFQKASLGYPLNNTDGISVAGTYQNGQHTGTIAIHEVAGANFPFNNLTLPYTSNSTYTVLSGTVGIKLNPSFSIPFTNKTFFQAFLNATFENTTWINSTITVPLNSTTVGKVQLKTFTVTHSYQDSMSVILTLKVVLKGDLMRFLFIGATPPTKLSKIYDDTLALWTRTDYTITYTRPSGLIVVQSTSHFPLDLDTRFNKIKSEFLNYTNATLTPGGIFLNKTYIWISNLNIQQTFTKVYTWQQVWGLVIAPPTVYVSPGKFKEVGLFNYTGYMSSKVNFTLVGGSNGTHVINIQTTSVPAPTTSSPTMATWWNFQNFTKLAPIVFSVAIQTASAPTNLGAVAGNATVTVTWSLPSILGGGIIHYNIYRGITSGGESMITTSTMTSFTDTGLTNGQKYYYRVSAVVTGGGEGPLATEVSATPSAPLVDINENPFTLTTNSTILNWSYNYNSTSGVATFQVQGNLGVGSLKIAVPTSLVQSASDVTITFDGTSVTPTPTTVGSNFIFSMTPYHYTTHNVKMVLVLASITSATTPFPWLIIGIVLIIIIAAGGGVYWYSKRKPSLKMPPATSTSSPPTPPPAKP